MFTGSIIIMRIKTHNHRFPSAALYLVYITKARCYTQSLDYENIRSQFGAVWSYQNKSSVNITLSQYQQTKLMCINLKIGTLLEGSKH